MRGGGRGDHFVRVKMVVPKELSEAEKKLFEVGTRVALQSAERGEFLNEED